MVNQQPAVCQKGALVAQKTSGSLQCTALRPAGEGGAPPLCFALERPYLQPKAGISAPGRQGMAGESPAEGCRGGGGLEHLLMGKAESPRL